MSQASQSSWAPYRSTPQIWKKGGEVLQYGACNDCNAHNKDFMMHNLFWRQAGFKAPNSWDNQADFAKWNPVIMQQAFHVISGSMASGDRHPLLNLPVSHRMVQHSNNWFISLRPPKVDNLLNEMGQLRWAQMKMYRWRGVGPICDISIVLPIWMIEPIQ
ncbi:uncharacterized protein F5147DRAFT_652921 [Suillus discolor]|uniref:Uncharacterized protein n=1 Tax=Suillus discolor TaxID=1912936 RepID=A0A9P7F7R6_9AGAM|nr:uncharacterized protein F5147DRAFT_652921 [Suillus discolor]KAG2108198.1 hypothetical protein F5147DRAFT_652921 [Suillus discolor]